MHSNSTSDSDPIPLFYDAALGEASWDDAVAAWARRMRGATIMLGVVDPKKPVFSQFWTEHFATHLHLEAGFSDDDIADPDMNPDLRGSMIMPVGRARDSRAYVSEDEMRRTPLYQATMFGQDLSIHHLFVAARDPDLWAGGFAAHRGGRALEEAEAGQLDAALPHIGRALRLRGEIARCQNVQAGLHSVLGSLSAGLLMVDADLRVLFANDAAEAMFDAHDGLRRERGRLLFTRATRRLVLEFVAACAAPDGAATVSGPVSVPRLSGLGAYALQVFPAIGFADLPGAARACATIVIRDLSGAVELPDAEVLADMFGLTPAEARVARLAPLAQSKRAVAERLGLTENTVKTHLGSVRAKLGVRNMTELARVVGRLPPGGPGSNGGR